MAKNNTEELLRVIEQFPDLPIVPMVYSEVVADDNSCYWEGSLGKITVAQYYVGREKVHFCEEWTTKEDVENTLADMVGCRYGETKDGMSIWDLTEQEWAVLYFGLPWKRAIIVYIETSEE